MQCVQNCFLAHSKNMLSVTIVLSLAALLALAAAQDDSRIPRCTSQEVNTYIAALPNSTACNMSFNNFFNAGNLTEDEYSTTVQTLCSVDCGQSIVELSVTNCRNLEVEAALRLFCLPRETGDNRCGRFFPNRLHDGESLVTALATCLAFDASTSSICPAGCASALMAGVNRLGCCYQNIYNNTDVFDTLVQEGMLTAVETPILQAVRQPALWEACNVSLTTSCTGEPFPGTSQLGIGVCTQAQELGFIFSLGQNCLNSLTTAFTPGNRPPESIFDSGVCVQNCNGRLSSFFRQTCLDQYAQLSSVTNCFHTSGELGGRCFYSNPIGNQFGSAVARSEFFSVARNTCLANSTAACPSGCQEALLEVKNQLGCCYQSIYNNSLTLDSLYVLHVITPEERAFFISLGSQELWDNCEVSLQPECTADPYGPAPTTGSGGALRLVASTMIWVFVVVVSFVN